MMFFKAHHHKHHGHDQFQPKLVKNVQECSVSPKKEESALKDWSSWQETCKTIAIHIISQKTR